VLRALAAHLQEACRGPDIVRRYGGEEFEVRLPGCLATTGLERADSLRAAVEAMCVGHGEVPLDSVTISVGVASYPEDALDASGLLSLADQALYASKAGGRGGSLEAGRSRPTPAVLNVGNSTPAELVDFVETLERVIGQRARRVEVPMQAGDVLETWADTRRLEALTGFAPRTPLEEGLRHMVAWLRAYDGEEEAQGAEEDLRGRSATTPGDAATLALGQVTGP